MTPKATFSNHKEPVKGPIQRLPPSCANCAKKKVRCNKRIPCSYCIERGLNCVLPSNTPAKPRKKRFAEAELLLRLRRYEALLRSHDIDPEDAMRLDLQDASSSPSSSQSLTNRQKMASKEAGPIDSRQDLESIASIVGPSLHTPEESSKVEKKSAQFNVQSVLRHLDLVFKDDGHEFFHFQDTYIGQAVPSPSPSQIVKLWQVYVDRVHCVVKLVNITSIQSLIFQYAAGVSKLTCPEIALVHAVYLAAVGSMTESEITECFSGKATLQVFAECVATCRTAFCRADVWRSADVVCLQSLLVYLLPVQTHVDPRSLASFYGLLDRLARRLGLHRHTQTSNIAEQEMNRRLWWELHAFDCRASEKSIGGAGALGGNITCPLPRFADDMESLTSLTTMPPLVRPGAGCLLAAVRWEIAQFRSQIREECHGNTGHFEMMSLSISRSRKLEMIDAFESHLQQSIFRFHDENEPLQQTACILSRGEVAKCRMFALADRSAINDDEMILENSLLQIQSDHQWHTTAIDKNLLLFINFNFHLIAYLYALSILSRMTLGARAQHGWNVVLANPWAFRALRKPSTENFEQQASSKASKPMLGALLVKAWEARATSLGLLKAQEPSLVTEARDSWAPALTSSTSVSNDYWSNDFADSALPSIDSQLVSGLSPELQADLDLWLSSLPTW